MAYIEQNTCPKRHARCLKACFNPDACRGCQFKKECCTKYCIFEHGSLVSLIQQDNIGILSNTIIPLVLDGKSTLEDLFKTA
jgi:hypothetical protein